MDENMKAKYQELADLIFPDVTETIENLEERNIKKLLKTKKKIKIIIILMITLIKF